MTRAEMFSMLAEALEVEESRISESTVIESVEEWNSIGWLTIMSLADERLGVQIDSKALREFKTAGDVANYLEGKGATAK